MNDRQILEHRLRTLEGLIHGPTPLTGPATNPIADKLAGRWKAEVQLLERLLADTQGEQVHETVLTWQARTDRFLESSNQTVHGWTDAQGKVWDARLVSELLAETSERLERWSATPEAWASE